MASLAHSIHAVNGGKGDIADFLLSFKVSDSKAAEVDPEVAAEMSKQTWCAFLNVVPE